MLKKCDLLLSESAYRDLNGPFSKEWRDLISTWSLTTEEELKQGLNWYKGLSKEEKESLFKRKDERRMETGVYKVVAAVKL